ncbi:hypothetical protein C0991_000113 [Blastosporella zonata]|nr:hypothetical protein C0991_000113 [Blastosporella zonata]
MKPRDYCCCAIPIVNAGIYTTLITQFTTATVVAVLSVATPSIVGAATPSFAAWVLAALCFAAAAVQLLGFIGVAREKPILFRRYITLYILITLAAFAVAAAWAVISATRHTTSKSNCLTTFFPDSSTTTLADKLCEIFPWVDVGIMGGIWVVLAVLQIYLYVILSSYSASQSRDHEKYDQLNADNIPMNARNDPWDFRLSTETPRSPQGYAHVRQESAASATDVLAQPQLQPKDTLSHHSEYSYRQGSYPRAQDHLDRKASTGGAGARDPQAHRPQYEDSYYNQT